MADCPWELPVYAAYIAIDGSYSIASETNSRRHLDNLTEQEADYLVLALNSYPKLVEACKLAEQWLSKSMIQEAIQYEEGSEKVLPMIKQALAEAEKINE